MRKLSLPRNLTHRTFSELLIVFSEKVNLLFVLISWSCGVVFCIRQSKIVENVPKISL